MQHATAQAIIPMRVSMCACSGLRLESSRRLVKQTWLLRAKFARKLAAIVGFTKLLQRRQLGGLLVDLPLYKLQKG